MSETKQTQVYKEPKFDFPVELQPVFANKTLEVPNKLAVIRGDTKVPLGVVSAKYGLLRHKMVVETFRDIFKGKDIEEKIILSKEGSGLTAMYTLNFQKVEVQKGDMVAMRLIVRNSYNGSNSLKFALGAVRLVCSNGMMTTKNFSSFSKRHIGKDMAIDSKEIADEIGRLVVKFKEDLPMMQKMTSANLKKKPEDFFDPKNCRLPKYLAKEALEQFKAAKEPTLWAAYNAMTNAVTFHMRKEKPYTILRLSHRAWMAATKELSAK